jgi:hypothetical protein
MKVIKGWDATKRPLERGPGESPIAEVLSIVILPVYIRASLLALRLGVGADSVA